MHGCGQVLRNKAESAMSDSAGQGSHALYQGNSTMHANSSTLRSIGEERRGEETFVHRSQGEKGLILVGTGVGGDGVGAEE
jgi:hypothetical protein